MGAGYFPQLDVILIDSEGRRVPMQGVGIEIWDEAGVTLYDTLTTDTDGILAEGIPTGAVDGEIVQFKHATYPGVVRRLLTATQDEAYELGTDTSAVLVLDDLSTPTTAAATGKAYLRDTAQPDLKPIYLGPVTPGSVNLYPYTTPMAKTAEIIIITEDEEGQLAEVDFALAESAALSIPASGAASVTVGTTAVISGTNNRVFYQSGGVLSQSANLTFDGNSLVAKTASAAAVPFAVQGAAAQTANLQEWKNSAGAVSAFVSAVGNLVVANTLHFGNIYDVSLTGDDSFGSTQFSTPRNLVFNATGAILFQSNANNAIYVDTAGNVGVGPTGGLSAKLTIVKTTEQLRVGYDGSNYASLTVDSSGVATFNAVGASAKFVFSDAVEVPDEAYSPGAWNADLSVPTKNSLADLGLVKNNETLGAPTASDDETQGYARMSMWADSATGDIYVCKDPATGAAVWSIIA